VPYVRRAGEGIGGAEQAVRRRKLSDGGFEFLAEKARERRFVLAFDEFPYAAAANRALKSILQTAIDHGFKSTGLFLILCGSHMGFMEDEVLGYKSPLFGRRTAQIKLQGFDYYDAGKMLDGFSSEDKIKLYACVGGMDAAACTGGMGAAAMREGGNPERFEGRRPERTSGCFCARKLTGRSTPFA
jgi:AAA+ ATPase superfamily predicted ATPase